MNKPLIIFDKNKKSLSIKKKVNKNINKQKLNKSDNTYYYEFYSYENALSFAIENIEKISNYDVEECVNLDELEIYENNYNQTKNGDQLSDELNNLNNLLKSGVLTQEEFEKAKKKILNN